ncbi:MAG TPA: chemotaxis protein CheX [Vicinamibacterales bacterium]|nr:chemotaxis protein CheX [Vicinamibacterales bacterium]
MPPASAIDSLLLDELTTATRDVFKTMVFQEVEASSPIAGDAKRPKANVVGTVAFAGKTSGLVVFYSSLDAAQIITASMLGIDPANVNGELPDAIGELTNMIAGSFRTRVAHARGETWAISVPTVTIGSDFYTKYVSDVQRVLCPFRMKNKAELFVELIVTRSAVQ